MSSELFWGSEKAEKNKGNIAYFLQSLAPPPQFSVLFSSLLLEHFDPESASHCFVTATDELPGPAAFQESVENEKP